jgi:hypothetical protein
VKQRPRDWSITDLTLLAHAELATNASITVYTMKDGQEFNRRPANPFLAIEQSFGRFAKAANQAGTALNEAFRAFRDALNGGAS